MALIIEDGSIVANADSYATVAEYKTYATKRGYTIPADNVIEQNLIKAMDYLQSFADKFKGNQVNPLTQVFAWPREYVVFGGADWPSNSIPVGIKNAQIQAAIEVASGVNLMPTIAGNGGAVVREKVGELETEYSEGVRFDSPRLPAVDALLKVWLKAGGFGLTTVRV